MPAAALVDTNVLLYAYDAAAGEKRARAAALLRTLASAGRGALSAQVLGEFYVNAIRKLEPPLAEPEARRSVHRYLASWTVLPVDGDCVADAVAAAPRHQLSYWDALIWATAKHHEVAVVVSEDFADGRLIEGVRFLDPFRDGFDVRSLA